MRQPILVDDVQFHYWDLITEVKAAYPSPQPENSGKEGFCFNQPAEHDVINEMGIAHNGTKVSIVPRSHNPRPAMGSPPATRSRVALPAVPPLTLAALGFTGGTAGYSVATLWVR